MHAFLLVVAATVIFLLVTLRVRWGDFPEDDIARLESEVLIGRRGFLPQQPDFKMLTSREYEKRLQQGTLSKDHDPKSVRRELLRQVRAKSTEVLPNSTRFFVFRNVTVPDEGDMVYLRYRFYLGSTAQSAQKQTQGVWGVRDPENEDAERTRFRMLHQSALSGTFHEIVIPGSLVAEDGLVVVSYLNDDPSEESVIFQAGDGPGLLVRETGFVSNYLRSIVLALLQLVFLAALGCTVGAAFSTPVAAFVGVSYLVIGIAVQAAVSAPITDEFGEFAYENVWDRVLHYVALGVDKVVVSLDDFDATSDLTRGRLVEFSRMGKALLGLVVLRGGILSAVGAWVLTRRELGAVIRK